MTTSATITTKTTTTTTTKTVTTKTVTTTSTTSMTTSSSSIMASYQTMTTSSTSQMPSMATVPNGMTSTASTTTTAATAATMSMPISITPVMPITASTLEASAQTSTSTSTSSTLSTSTLTSSTTSTTGVPFDNKNEVFDLYFAGSVFRGLLLGYQADQLVLMIEDYVERTLRSTVGSKAYAATVQLHGITNLPRALSTKPPLRVGDMAARVVLPPGLAQTQIITLVQSLRASPLKAVVLDGTNIRLSITQVSMHTAADFPMQLDRSPTSTSTSGGTTVTATTTTITTITTTTTTATATTTIITTTTTTSNTTTAITTTTTATSTNDTTNVVVDTSVQLVVRFTFNRLTMQAIKDTRGDILIGIENLVSESSELALARADIQTTEFVQAHNTNISVADAGVVVVVSLAPWVPSHIAQKVLHSLLVASFML